MVVEWSMREVIPLTAPLSLTEYEEAERRLSTDDAKRGFVIHAWVTVIVVATLVVINVTVASEFPWSIFPAVGMSVGLFFHYMFGVRGVEQTIQDRRDRIKDRALSDRDVHHVA